LTDSSGALDLQCMATPFQHELVGDELTARERRVLEAVVRTYVDFAEPAGSRTVARRFDLGISAATVRNTMSDLEEKGYLFHPHTSAGRVPTDRAYRFFVDRLIRPTALSEAEREHLVHEIDLASAVVERMVRRATQALSLLSQELGVAIAPRLDGAVLERLELTQVSSRKILMVATLKGGVARTVYVDLPGEVPPDVLVSVTMVLNERLAGLTLKEVRETLPDRLRDSSTGDDATGELLNIFMQSGQDLFDWQGFGGSELHLGHASVLATQPEFSSGKSLKGLIELTERHDLLAGILQGRSHPGGLRITIGGENRSEALSDFTLITAEYRVGDLRGVIGVIGPTRMPYEKVISIVDYTSSLVSSILGPT
jgi:heat-inducible transcriptional repressor